MDMEHEIKKDAPSAQQAAGSIADDPQYKRMLWNVAQDWTRTDRHIALACYIERWADSRAAATPAQPIAPQPEPMTTDEAREFLIGFMNEHFTDRTFYRYIRADPVDKSRLAGDFAWQMATALRKIGASPCAMCHGTGSVGHAPDDYFDCPDCTAPVAQPIAVSRHRDEQDGWYAAAEWVFQNFQEHETADDMRAAIEAAAPDATTSGQFQEGAESLAKAFPDMASISMPSLQKSTHPAAPHWLDSPQSALGGKTAREGYAANPLYADTYAAIFQAEPNAWKALTDKAIAILNRHIVPDGISDKDALAELYGIFDGPDYRAARAAAPVSGPTCKACNGAGTWIGQHDGYDDADCAVCDGSGKAAPVSGQSASALPPLLQKSAIGWKGQSMTELAYGHTDGAMARYGQLCIDSRPRSEDSRADTLEEAAEACENLVESIGDAAAYDQREMYDTELERMHTAMACAAAIRALASTTPQKADDE